MTLKITKSFSPLALTDLEGVLRRTRIAWEQLRGQRIFITGGTGFFGKWLVETFAYAVSELDLDATLVLLTRDPQRFLKAMPHLSGCESVTFEQGDVRDFNFPTGEFSHVIHAATEASASLNQSAPRTMLDVIVEGTRRVLDFSESCGAQRILMVSSGAVYGTQPSDITHVSEDYLGGPDPLSPSSAYGEGKRVAELLCGEMHSRSGVAIPIARCFAFVGPFLPLDRHFAIGNFLRDTLLRKPVVLNSAGRDFRSYMYAADLAAWLWTMLTRVDGCRAYNVGSDAAISIAELARAVAVLTETEVVQRCSDSPIGKSPTYYVPSIERAKRELGLEIELDLQTAVARTFAWYQQRYAKVDVTEDCICA